MGNFEFIRAVDIYLCTLGEQAEKLCLIDPDAAIVKLRKFGEMLGRTVAEEASIDVSMATPHDVLLDLGRRQILAQPQLRRLHQLRIEGNAAVHPDHDGDPEEAVRRLPSEEQAIDLLAAAHELAVWFHGRRNGKGPAGAFRRPSTAPSAVPTESPTPVTVFQTTPLAVVVAPSERKADSPSRPTTLLTVETSDPVEYIERLVREVATTARTIREDARPLESALAGGRGLIESARAPFRLGVVGEFRSGKSTLISALLGVDVALRGAGEITPGLSRYGHGPQDEARFIFQDGREERMGHDEANRRLHARRRDPAWLATLDRAEFESSRAKPLPFDLWDAPGLGGRDDNEAVANRFIDSIAGAIWVFDPNFLGSATVVTPLQKLRSAGKRILGVVNRADTLSPSEVEEATAYVRENYAPFLDGVCAASAREMLENPAIGDELRDELLGQIQRTILNTSEADRALRVDRAIGACARGVAEAVRNIETRTRNRAGLVRHIRLNFDRATERTLAATGRYIDEAAENAFAGEGRSARAAMDDVFQAGKSNEARVKRLLDDLDEKCSLKSAWPAAVRQVLRQVEADWLRHGQAAVQLTKATIDEPANLDQLSRVSIDITTQVDAEIEARVEETATIFGVGSAVGLGALAAASAAISWPIILAAIPIGLMAGHFESKKLAAQPRVDLDDAKEALGAIVRAKRAHLATALHDEVPGAAQAVLQGELDRILAAFDVRELSGLTLPEFERHAESLSRARNGLDRLASQLVDGEVPTDYAVLDEFDVPAGADAARVLGALIGRTATRVDIATASPDAELREVLLQIRPGTRVRWLTSCRREQVTEASESARRQLTSWRGESQCRAVWRGDGAPIALSELVIISEHGAWLCNDSTDQIGIVSTRWARHPFGQLAASRTFAEFWTGTSLEHGELHVHKI